MTIHCRGLGIKEKITQELEEVGITNINNIGEWWGPLEVNEAEDGSVDEDNIDIPLRNKSTLNDYWPTGHTIDPLSEVISPVLQANRRLYENKYKKLEKKLGKNLRWCAGI